MSPPFIEGKTGMKGIVVLSGGMDSAVALSLALTECNDVGAVSFHYKQRHDIELKSAQDLCEHYGIPHRIIGVTLGEGGLLMDHQAPMVNKTYEELEQSQGPSPTYVPYRNGSFLSLAASFALSIEFDTLYCGMHAEDAHNWAYPDCTPEFIGAMQNAIYVGTYHKVRLVAPFTYKTKADIVRLGVILNTPFHLTHSCYEGKRPACGKCPTCIGRLEAFKQTGRIDPLEYEFDRYRKSGHLEALEDHRMGI